MNKLLALLLLLVPSFIGAQKYWKLEDCIQYAFQENIQLKRQELSTDLKKKQFHQSYFELLPNLNVGASHSISSGRSLNYDNYSWLNTTIEQGSIGVQSEMTLFNGLQNYYNIKQSRYDMLSGIENLQKAKNDISLSIANAYLQILYYEDVLQLAQGQLEVSRLQAEKIQKMVEVGSKPRGAWLEIKAQEALDHQNMVSANNDVTISYLTLTQLLDLDSAQGFKIVHPDSLQVESAYSSVPIEEVYNLALQNMPDVKISEYAFKKSEYQLAKERGLRYPVVSLNAQYSSRYNDQSANPRNLKIPPPNPLLDYPYSSQLNDNKYKQLSLQLNVPIFNRYQTQSRISAARIQMFDSQYAHQQSKQTLYKEIQQAHANAIAAWQKFVAGKLAVEANEESFRYVQQKYDVGLVSSVDFFVAKNNLLKAQVDLVQAKYQYVFRIRILDFYTGKAIKI